MSAAETYDLHIFQIIFLRCKDSRRKHPCMIIINNIQPAFFQFSMLYSRKRVCSKHRYSHFCKHIRQIMIYQGVILIRPGSQDHCISALFLHLSAYFFSRFQKFLMERILGFISGCNSLSCQLRRDLESIFHISGQLPVPVSISIPVEKRRVKRNIPAFLRII